MTSWWEVRQAAIFLPTGSAMQAEITILTDNTANYGYLAEWGLSIFLKVGDVCLLYDCGFTSTAVHNADLLGVDLRSVDAIVLSHGHADHTGGLRQVLARFGGKRIFAHPAALERKVRRSANSPDLDIGIPLESDELQSLGGQLKPITTPQEISSSVMTSGEVPMGTTFERVDQGLYHAAQDGLEPDPLLDDISMAIKTDAGLVVLLGCAHRGPINTIRHFQAVTGDERIHAVVGGMHLMRSEVSRIDETVQELKALGVNRLACGHCTGFDAMARLANEFGDRFTLLGAGTRLNFPSV